MWYTREVLGQNGKKRGVIWREEVWEDVAEEKR